jgi:hypothetical protein
MHTQRSRSLVLAVCASLALVACGDKEKGGGTKAHDHGPLPHGGELLELGNEAGHLEMMHDHTGGTVVVYVYGSSFEKPLHVAMPVITIRHQDADTTVPLTPVDPKPDGTAHQWKGGHDGLKTDPWIGRIDVVIDGKSYRSPLEGPAHEHK